MDKIQINELRGIPLQSVLESFDAQRDPKDKNNWRTSAGRITVTDQQFYNHDEQKGGGGAIDLTTHLGGFKFPEALAYLASLAGRVATVEQYKIEADKHANRIIDRTPAPKKEIPSPDASKLSRVRAYLTDVRGISDELVQKTIASGRLWADKYGNAVFALHDPGLSGKLVGAELRGTYDTPFHGVRGEQKGMFFTGTAKTKKAVMVESAIDALSYEDLHPKSALIVSTTGATKENLIQVANGLRAQGYGIVSGFDNDKDGERFTKTLESTGPITREKPLVGKDWNNQLQELRKQQKEMPRKETAQKKMDKRTTAEHER